MNQPTLSEFIKTLQSYHDEMDRGRHKALTDKLYFYFRDEKGEIHSLKIEDIDATRIFGCGCWTGASITFEIDKD